MPIYEFECNKCKEVIETRLSYDDDLPTQCPCGGEFVKMISWCTFRLKGSGWPGISRGKLEGGGTGVD